MNGDRSGLSAERTVLAWNRTALASAALAGLMIRVVSRAFPVVGAVGVAALLVGAGLVGGVACLRRGAQLRRLGMGAGALAPRNAALVMAAVVATGVTAFTIGVLHDGLFVL